MNNYQNLKNSADYHKRLKNQAYLPYNHSSQAKPQDILASYFQAVTSHSVQKILAIFDSDAQVETDRRIYRGHAEIQEFYEQGILKFNQFFPKPGPLFINGDQIAVEITLYGNGKKRKVGDFFEFKNGLITKLVVYSGYSQW